MNPYLEAALSSLCAGIVTGGGVLTSGGSRDWTAAMLTFAITIASTFGIAIHNLHKEPPQK